MIIAGGEPELCCGMAGAARHAKREGGVYARPYALRVQKSCSECGVHVMLYVEKCEKGFVRSDRREQLTYVKAKDGDTDKEPQVWRGSLVSPSFQPRSSLHGCLCFSLSHRRRSRSCSYHHYALHCLPPRTCTWAWHGVQRVHVHATYQYHVNGTDTVGRSVDARGPVDHASVGLAQARPN